MNCQIHSSRVFQTSLIHVILESRHLKRPANTVIFPDTNLIGAVLIMPAGSLKADQHSSLLSIYITQEHETVYIPRKTLVGRKNDEDQTEASDRLVGTFRIQERQ